MSDPWKVCNSNNINCLDENNKIQQDIVHKFEDNFEIKDTQSLPDSEQYLKSLEKKLYKIKNDPNVLKQLAEKREECLRNLLNNRSSTWTDNDIELDAPIINGESTVQEIYRYICPVQPLNVGEIIHIVKYDQLEEQNNIDEQENTEKEEENKQKS